MLVVANLTQTQLDLALDRDAVLLVYRLAGINEIYHLTYLHYFFLDWYLLKTAYSTFSI